MPSLPTCKCGLVVLDHKQSIFPSLVRRASEKKNQSRANTGDEKARSFCAALIFVLFCFVFFLSFFLALSTD